MKGHRGAPHKFSRRAWTGLWIFCLMAVSAAGGNLLAHWQHLSLLDLGTTAEEAAAAAWGGGGAKAKAKSGAEPSILLAPPVSDFATGPWKRECSMERCPRELLMAVWWWGACPLPSALLCSEG